MRFRAPFRRPAVRRSGRRLCRRGESRAFEQSQHGVVVVVGVDAECPDAPFPRQFLHVAQKFRRHALAAFAVGDCQAVHQHVGAVGEPFAFEGFVGRFPVEYHRTVGDHRVALLGAGSAQHVAAAAADVRRNMPRSGIAVLPLAAACRIHPGLCLTDDLHDVGYLVGYRLPEYQFFVHAANVKKCWNNVVLSGRFFTKCDNS